MGKIFVRERTNIGQGTGKPRYAIVAVSDIDLKVYHSHVRHLELEKMAADLGAELVHLPRGGESEDEIQHGSGMGRRKRRRKNQG